MMFSRRSSPRTLNLDTSVVFLTPVLLQTARFRSVKEEAFLYGSIFMANAASLLLLGSNLTNILVFSVPTCAVSPLLERCLFRGCSRSR